MTTDVDHPICASKCPDSAKYIDPLTNSNSKVCVSSVKIIFSNYRSIDNAVIAIKIKGTNL